MHRTLNPFREPTLDAVSVFVKVRTRIMANRIVVTPVGRHRAAL